MMMKSKTIFGFRKNKAVKTLCGAIVTVGIMSLGITVNADEVTTSVVETPDINLQSPPVEQATSQGIEPQTSALSPSDSSVITETPVVEKASPTNTNVIADNGNSTPVNENVVNTTSEQPVVQASQPVENSFEAVTAQSVAPSIPKITIQQDGNNLNLKYNGTTQPTEKILYAVWSDKNSQDDLSWYTADSQNAFTVDLSKEHKEYGLYNIHTYSLLNGNLKGLDTNKFEIKLGKPTVTVTKVNDDLYNVLVENVGKEFTSVSLPIWSDNGGQDDLNWNTSNRNADGSFSGQLKVSAHHFDTGLYNIHLYGKSLITSGDVGLLATSYKIADTNVVTSVQNKGNNSYQVTFTNVPSYISSLKVPIWSDKNGQDDIKWYDATKVSSTSYTTIFTLAEHNDNIGLYNIHAYGKTYLGNTIGLSAITTNINDLTVTSTPLYSVGQTVEIQNFASNESNGYDLTGHREWIGSVYQVAKNTNNSAGGWEYHIKYSNGMENIHVLEQDLRFVYNVALKTTNNKIQNNIALQQAFNYANSHKNITLYMPKGDFVIGSNIQESDLGKISGNEYIILSSDTKLRGNDQKTNLIVDGTMLWFGLPTGTRGIDGVSNLTIDNINVKAKDLINGDYFMMMFNHGNNITVKNSSFTMVQRKSRHIFDLGGVQNITIKNNKFIGYAPSLTNVTVIPSGADLHDYYAETIQVDASNNAGGWDASMIKNIATSAYMAYNTSTSVLSSNVAILNNQLLPFYNNGRLVARSSTVGQHSSQVGNIFVVGNRFEKTLSQKFNVNSWVMKPIHYINASGYGADIRNNTII